MKTAIPVDRKALEAAVAEAEKGQTFSTQAALWEATTAVYNRGRSENKITPSVARLRVLEYGIAIKTVSARGKGRKGREATPVDRDRLLKAVAEIEKHGPLSKRSELYDAVAARYNEGADQPITSSVVDLRLGKWAVPLKTPKARSVTGGTDGKAVRKRKLRVLNRDDNQKGMTYLLEVNKVSKLYLPLVDKVMRGSRSAAVKLNCLACCGFNKREVRLCSDSACPMHQFRPFQRKEES